MEDVMYERKEAQQPVPWYIQKLKMTGNNCNWPDLSGCYPFGYEDTKIQKVAGADYIFLHSQ